MTSVATMDTYWKATARSRDRAPLEAGDAACDVAVLGGGFAGLSTALHLMAARPGLDVVLLEAERVGFGASGRNAGMVLPYPLIPTWLLDGPEAETALSWLERQVHALAAQLREIVPGGEIAPASLAVVARSALVDGGLAWIHRRAIESGHPAIRLDAAGCEARTGSTARGGIVLDAYRVQPHRLARALAAECERLGMRLYEEARVNAIHADSGGVRITTTRGELRAGRAVLCTNAYTDGLGVRVTPHAKVGHTYMLATERLDSAAVERLGGTSTLVGHLGSGKAYRRIHDGRLLFGGLDVWHRPPTRAAANDPRAFAKLERMLRATLPWLSDVRIDAEWGGPFHVTKADVPVVRALPDLPGVVLNVGYGGSGVALSLLSGRWVQGLVLGESYADTGAERVRRAFAKARSPIASVIRRVLRLLMGTSRA